MKSRRAAFAILFAVPVCIGCGGQSEIGTPKPIASAASEFPSITLAQLPSVDIGTAQLEARFKPELVLLGVEDGRSEQVVLRYKGKEVVPVGDATLGVRYALTKAFRQKGIAIKDKAALQLTVRITGWNAKVKEQTVTSSAVLTAQLVAAGDQPVFSGLFEGSAAVASPQVLDRDVETALQQAMGKALSRLIQDPKLLETLTSY